MGLGEGITFPSWHSLYARWIPFNERTRAIAITNSGISAGTVFGYIATAIIIAAYSWELVFYSFGMLGIIIERDPLPLPKLSLPNIKSLEDIHNYSIDEFKLENYKHHPAIKAKMAV